MQFQVPQFIETEDRIVGPLTIKQFLYVAIGSALCFLLFFYLNPVPWALFSLLIMGIAVSFAFLQINGRPLSVALISAASYYWKPRMYLWQRKPEKGNLPKLKTPQEKFGGIKSSLENLMNQLKTSKNPIPQREKIIQPSILDRTKSSKERFEVMRKITGEKEIARRVDYR